jgi:hypothetical protein
MKSIQQHFKVLLIQILIGVISISNNYNKLKEMILIRLHLINYMTCENVFERLILQVAIYVIDFDWFKFQIVTIVKEFCYKPFMNGKNVASLSIK